MQKCRCNTVTKTWLLDINCNKISEFMSDFDVFRTSAMEHKLSVNWFSMWTSVQQHSCFNSEII